MAPTPRVVFVRHGETAWSLSGQHTSVTDLDLTSNGVQRMKATGSALVGDDRLIVPKFLDKIFVSPRTRAQHTMHLLIDGHKDEINAPVEVTDRIREWDYGDYEGKTTAQIRELRKSRGLDKERPWSIWQDGCEGGESPDQVAARLDDFIEEIVVLHRKAVADNRPSEILVIAHGHILRSLVLRWLKRPMENPQLLLEAGGVGVLSYEHHNCDERAISLGGAFMVPGERGSAD